MKSALPKVLHEMLGKRLIEYSLQSAQAVSATKPVVVIGHEGDQVRLVLGEQARFAVQERLGTADAVKAARELIKGESDLVVVISADMPSSARKPCRLWWRHNAIPAGDDPGQRACQRTARVRACAARCER